MYRSLRKATFSSCSWKSRDFRHLACKFLEAMATSCINQPLHGKKDHPQWVFAVMVIIQIVTFYKSSSRGIIIHNVRNSFTTQFNRRHVRFVNDIFRQIRKHRGTRSLLDFQLFSRWARLSLSLSQSLWGIQFLQLPIHHFMTATKATIFQMEIPKKM